jgi:hypothetical protein
MGILFIKRLADPDIFKFWAHYLSGEGQRNYCIVYLIGKWGMLRKGMCTLSLVQCLILQF